jgi:hypothetical protein
LFVAVAVIVRFPHFSLLHFVTPGFLIIFIIFIFGCDSPDAEVKLRLSSRLPNVSVPELWSTYAATSENTALYNLGR